MDEPTYRVLADHAWRLAEALKSVDLAEGRLAASVHGSVDERRLFSALIAVIPLLPEHPGHHRATRPMITCDLLLRSIGIWHQDLTEVGDRLPDDHLVKREVLHVAGGMAQALQAAARLPKAEY